MEEIGLFPLGIVLLPTERLPLHIFEERYKELIGECLLEGRDFGLVLADDDGLREIGTRAAVIEVLDQFEDGRMNIVVEGRERFRLRQLTSGRAFQTGEIEALEDERSGASAAEVERAVGLLRRVAELAGAAVDDLEATAEPSAFELAARVEFEPAVKQRLLELRSEPERLQTLAELLDRAVRALEAQQERSQIAQQNGRVPLSDR